jgi:cell division initiation protein
MERIMPIDLERAQLRTRFRGFDRDQVQALLQRSAKEMSSLRGDMDALASENAKLQQEVQSFRAQENTLKEALILAQKTADETRASAHKEAELILDQSRHKASDAESQMQTRINDLRFELEQMRLEKQKFLSNYRAILEAQLRDIAEMGGYTVLEGDAASHAAEAG